MRVAYGLIAGSLVLAGAVGAAWSQAPKQAAPTQIQTVSPPVVAPVSDLRVRPVGDGRLSVPVTTVKELTAAECKALGGEVRDDVFNVCGSKQYCFREDNKGNTYRVCLSK